MTSFIQDDSIQGTTTSILTSGTSVSIFATSTYKNNLSSYSTLNISGLNDSVTTQLGYIINNNNKYQI